MRNKIFSVFYLYLYNDFFHSFFSGINYSTTTAKERKNEFFFFLKFFNNEILYSLDSDLFFFFWKKPSGSFLCKDWISLDNLSYRLMMMIFFCYFGKYSHQMTFFSGKFFFRITKKINIWTNQTSLLKLVKKVLSQEKLHWKSTSSPFVITVIIMFSFT